MGPNRIIRIEVLNIVVTNCWPKIGGIVAVIRSIDWLPNVV